MFIGYSVEKKPYVSVGIMDSYSNVQRQWQVDLPRPVMMHDMAATQRYVVLLDLPLCFDPEVGLG
jgi:carotenoid cleavage dioxygenase-like enzyme